MGSRRGLYQKGTRVSGPECLFTSIDAGQRTVVEDTQSGTDECELSSRDSRLPGRGRRSCESGPPPGRASNERFIIVFLLVASFPVTRDGSCSGCVGTWHETFGLQPLVFEDRGLDKARQVELRSHVPVTFWSKLASRTVHGGPSASKHAIGLQNRGNRNSLSCVNLLQEPSHEPSQFLVTDSQSDDSFLLPLSNHGTNLRRAPFLPVHRKCRIPRHC